LRPQASRRLSSQASIKVCSQPFSAEQARGLEAFQALVLVGEIKRGDDVLVHAAASGVGIASIQLARFYGA
jgi:NADPH:quinone reductase-like Zn-dependent oxidoreductase